MTGAIERRAARVLVLDETDALLLMHGVDPSDGTAGSWWFTPGGGLETGETFREAALRELAEETGAGPADLVELPGERVAEFAFDGRLLRQTERFFAVRLIRFAPSSAGWTELEARATLDMRWWTPAEFAADRPRAYPEDLIERWEHAAGLLRGSD